MRELNDAKSGKYVCKYMGAETLMLNVLPSRQVRLSPFKEMNDPRETNGGGFELEPNISEPTPSTIAEKSKIESNFRKMYTDNSFIFCATLDEYTENKVIQRGYGMPRMWAQYGGNHSGACLVFDREELQSLAHQKFPNHCWHDKVDYDPLMLEAGAGAYQFNYEYKSNGFEYFTRHAQQYKEGLYFRKHDDWKGEREWRIAALSEEKHCNKGLFLPYGDALKYIILGDRATANTIQAVRYMYEGAVLQLKYAQYKEDFLLTTPPK